MPGPPRKASTSPPPNLTANDRARLEAVALGQRTVVNAQRHLWSLSDGHPEPWVAMAPQHDVPALVVQHHAQLMALQQQLSDARIKDFQSHLQMAHEERSQIFRVVKHGWASFSTLVLKLSGINNAQAREAAALQQSVVQTLQAVALDPAASEELKRCAMGQLTEHARLAHASIGSATRVPLVVVTIALVILSVYDGWMAWLFHFGALTTPQDMCVAAS